MSDVNPFFIMGAIHSVALSHDESCGCIVCCASHGDPTALAKVFAAQMTAMKTFKNRHSVAAEPTGAGK